MPNAHGVLAHWRDGRNPEPSAAWDGGDSVMREYAAHCDSVVECRDVRQLREFIERLI